MRDGPRSVVNWRRLGLPTILLGLPVLGIAAIWAVGPWVALFPRDLGRRWTEGFLRVLLVGYSVVLVLSLVGLVGLGWAIVRARRRGQRRPVLARLLLLSASCLIALAGAEGVASAWLAWSHRMPSLPTRFAGSPRDVVSIVVVGGSSARGYPYLPWLSVGQIVGWKLGQADPGRRFEVDVRAREGATLEQMHQGLARLKRRPDVIIIYSGHNEFQSRFEGSRDVGLDEAPSGPLMPALYRLSQASPLCRLVYETISKHRLGGPPPPMSRHQLIDPPMISPSERAEILSDFHRRLEAIVAYCERIGALPILIIPPANDAGFDPNRSVLPGSVPRSERSALTQEFQAARLLEAADPERAEALYRAILARQSGFAEAHFRLGGLLRQRGQVEAARRQFSLARDDDGFPVRCPTPFQDVYRQVAALHDSILIDGPAVVLSISPSGYRDDNVFHDAHHPTFLAHVALAQAVLDAIHARRALGGPSGRVTPIDPARCASHFEVGEACWLGVCARTATFYRDFAPARFDPSMRLAKQRAYERAGKRIQLGQSPESTGVPGLGIHPDACLDPSWWTSEPAGRRDSLSPDATSSRSF